MNQENNSTYYFPARDSLRQNILWIASIALVYFAMARFSFSLVFRPEGIAAIWPPEGIFLSAILLTRRNVRPYLVGVLFITDFIAEMLTGTPLPLSFLYSCSLTIDAVIGSWLLIHFVGEEISFGKIQNVISFLFISVIFSNALGSLFMAAGSKFLIGTPFCKTFELSTASEGIGNLFVTPLIISWVSLAKTGFKKWNLKRAIEGAFLFIPLILLNHVVFHYFSNHSQFSLLITYSTFPYLLWASLRFGVRGTMVALVLIAVNAFHAVVTGNIISPVNFFNSDLDAVIIVQLFMTILAIPSIFLAAIMSERKQTLESLRESEEQYRSLYDNTPAMLHSIDTHGNLISVSEYWLSTLGYTRNEVLGRKSTDFLTDASRKYANEIVLPEFWKTENCNNIEYEFVKKNGEVINCLLSAISERDESGKVVSSLAVITDITERKRTDETLRLRESYLSAIIENQRGLLWLKDRDGKFLAVNTKFANACGLDNPKFLVGKTDLDVWPPELAERYITDDKKVVQSKKQYAVEEPISDKGEIRWFDTFKTPILDKQGNVIGTTGYSYDITERKRTEDEIKFKKEELQTLNNIILKINTTVDLKSRLEYIMDESLKVVDLEGGTICLLNPDDTFDLAAHRETSEETILDLSLHKIKIGECLCGNCAKECKPLILTTRKEVLDFATREVLRGEDIRFHAAFPFVIKGKCTGILCVFTRTDKKPTGSSLKLLETIVAQTVVSIENAGLYDDMHESETKFRSIFENSSVGIALVGLDGQYLMVNSALCKIYGYSTEELLGNAYLNITHPDDMELSREIAKKVLEGRGKEIRFSKRYIHKDKHIVWTEVSSATINDAKGDPLYFITHVTDITERRQIEEELRQMQKLEGLGTLAGGIAHDFNNILGIILAYNTSINMFRDDKNKLDLAIETISKAVERGKNLVQQILTFARKTETSFGAVNVNDVVMETMIMIYETFPKMLTYSQNLDKSIPFINADRSQLHQTLLNLCVNARDAMPNGGVLTINTSMVSAANLRNQHQDANASSYVCIEVGDTGEGMTLEIQKRIFELFFTTKGIGKGTGLGLAVAFGVIQTHKGFIDVESELGKGATFRIYLPVSEVAESIIEREEDNLEEIPGGTETLLVVEDEEMLMKSLQTILIGKGYNILSAGDGNTALKIYQERGNDISLVLTDLGLPNISGLEVCQKIKKINPEEHMILSTGFLDPEMKVEFLKVGIQHFLFKPYDLKKVLKEVRQVLDEK